MVDRSLQFEQAISGGDKATLVAYCQQQEQQSSAQEAETWRFLRLNVEDDARRSAASALSPVDKSFQGLLCTVKPS